MSLHTAIADLNGDGKPDLYTTNAAQPNRLLLGDGKGGFAEVTSGPAVSGSKASQVGLRLSTNKSTECV